MSLVRSQFLRKIVLDEICDDYENVDQAIFPNVARDAALCGLTVERDNIVQALTELVGLGFAQSYILSSHEPSTTKLLGMPALDVVEEYFETFFYVTPEGRQFHNADDFLVALR